MHFSILSKFNLLFFSILFETPPADLIAPEYLHSIVVFMPECEFKTVMPMNVFKGKDWVNYVKAFKHEVIPAMKLKRIQQCIEKEMLEKSWKTDRLHVANLKQHKNNR